MKMAISFFFVISLIFASQARADEINLSCEPSKAVDEDWIRIGEYPEVTISSSDITLGNSDFTGSEVKVVDSSKGTVVTVFVDSDEYFELRLNTSRKKGKLYYHKYSAAPGETEFLANLNCE